MFLFLQDGLLPSSGMIDDAVRKRESTIYTRAAASSDDRHERIDLNDRWAGLAVLQGKLVHNLDDIPEDWNLGSALLRQAVQGGARRKQIDISPGSSFRSDLVQTNGDAHSAEKRLIADYRADQSARRRGLLARVGRFFSGLVLPYIWNGALSHAQFRLIMLGAGLLTLFLALLGLSVPAIFAAIGALLLHEAYKDEAAVAGISKAEYGSEAGSILLLLLAVSSPVGVVATAGFSMTAVSAGLLFPLALAVAKRLDPITAVSDWRMDPMAALVAVAALSAIGLSLMSAVLTVATLTLGVALAYREQGSVKANLTGKE